MARIQEGPYGHRVIVSWKTRKVTLQMETSQIRWGTPSTALGTPHSQKTQAANQHTWLFPLRVEAKGAFPQSAMDSWEMESEKSACSAFGRVEEQV